MEYKLEDKYNSMQRSLDRLIKINTNNGSTISNTEAKDATEDVFNQLYHFKDWLKKDPAAGSTDVENYINGSNALSFAADYCNSFKHGGLDKTSRSGQDIQKVNTHITMDFTSAGVITSSHLEITVSGKKLDALVLAKQCLAEWDKFLTLNKLDGFKSTIIRNEATTQAHINGTARIIKPE